MPNIEARAAIPIAAPMRRKMRNSPLPRQVAGRRATAASLRSLLEEPDDDQENDRPDDGIDDCRDDAADQDEADQRQYPAGNHRTNDADHDIANQSETVALDEQAREPASDCADDQPNDERFDHDHPPHS